MKINKLSIFILVFILISSISVTATIDIIHDTKIENTFKFNNEPPTKMEDKIIPDITKFSSKWIEFSKSEDKE